MINISILIFLAVYLCGCVPVEKPASTNRGSADLKTTEEHSKPAFYQGAWDGSVQSAADVRTSTEAEQRADTAKKKGDNNKAAAYYARAIELDKKNVNAGYKLAILHEKAGNAGQAEQLYRFLLKQSPRHIASLEGMGLIVLDQNNIKDARRLLVKAVAIFENQTDAEKNFQNYAPVKAFNGLGQLADREGKYEQAKVYYRQGLNIDPDSVVLMNNLAYSFYLAGDWKQAEDRLHEVLRINPQYTRAVYNLALTNVRARRYQRAVELMRQFMEPYEANNDIGYLAMMSGDSASAEELFQQAIDQAPSYYQSAWRNMDKLKQLRSSPED